MEQTTLNSFYSTRKNSGSLPPSKRQKLENVNPIRRTRTLRSSSSSKASKRLLAPQEQVTIPSSQSSELDQSLDDRRKVSYNARKLTQTCDVEITCKKDKAPEQTNIVDQSVFETSEVANLPSLPQEQWISEQANLVLRSKQIASAKRTSAKSTPSHPVLAKSSVPVTADTECARLKPTSPRKSHYAASVNSRGDLSSLASTSSTSVPAHVRYASLATKPARPTLVLPKKYKLLLDQFRCTDSVLYLLQQRSEVCTFQRLKQSVQQMSGRNFSIDHLAMILTVYPNSFNIQYEKGLRNLDGHKQRSIQMTVEAQFSDVLSKTTSAKGKAHIPSTVLLTRRDHFQSRLITIVKQHHKVFLDKVGMVVPDRKLFRWHPKFEVDNLPDFEKAQLPASPTETKYSTANEILNDTSVHMNSRIKEALETIAKKSNETETTIPEKTLPEIEKPGSKIMNGVSNDLLERIRQKEKLKQELDMQRTPADDKHRSMIDRLPDIARILKTFFTTEKKAAIPLEDCVQKLEDSHTSATSKAALEDLIKLLAKEFPTWMTIVTVRKCPYVKLCKTIDINMILTKIKQLN